jgi:hypothetical protein
VKNSIYQGLDRELVEKGFEKNRERRIAGYR